MTESDNDKTGVKKYDPPDLSVGDAAHTVARAGLSLIPVAGGPLVELLNTVIAPSIQKRMHQWMCDIGEGLRELESREGLKLEDLKDNEIFVDTVMQATEAARRTSNSTKREALKNAVLNAALPGAPEEVVQQILLNHVDRFNEWHIRLLDLADDPVEWFTSRQHPFPAIMGGLQSIVERAFPSLVGKREFFDQIWRDLYTSGLINSDSLQGMMTPQGLKARRTTELGRQLLHFISDPTDGAT